MTVSRQPIPQYAQTQGALIISAAPVDAQSVVGKSLLQAGVLTVAGLYECEFALDATNTVEAELMPTTVVGTFKPYLRAYRVNRKSFRAADESAGSNFANGVTQVLTLTNLNGKLIGKVVFTIPGASSVVFTEGTDQTAPGAIAEVNCL